MKAGRGLALSLLLLGSVAFALGGATASAQAPDRVVAVRLDGVVDPFLASYAENAIADANASGAAAVLVEIDTPGGLATAMRDIVQAILGSRVPVVCYVSPEGARAASAGTFVLIACPVAAMAPGTNVGAAHPVGISGAIASQKAENDAVAYIRSLAERRDRNADWAEDAVRESESVTAEDALELDVIDLVAADRLELLEEVDGRTVEVTGEERVRLETAGASIDERSLGLGASILHSLLTPDLAFIFFYAGLILILVEVFTPGLTVPGVLGALLLLAAFASFGLLPVTLLGLVLLLISVVAFVVDFQVPGTGIATAVGIVALVLGGMFLFDSSVPNASVSWPTILAVGALFLLFSAVVVRKVLQSRWRPTVFGQEALVGAVGVATTDLEPRGLIRARGEEWSAESVGPTIHRGSAVRVVAMQGITAMVTPAPADEPDAGETATPDAPDVAPTRSER